MTKWLLKQCSIDITQIACELNISNIIAQLLYVRGYKAKEEMSAFLSAENQTLTDYHNFHDMEKGINLISQAITNGLKITIFGDYDADGIMSTVILYRSISALGGNVSYYIPNRENEGYGLNNEAIAKLKDQGTQVILACDNGVSAIEQIDFAKSLGLITIIIDHHDVQIDIKDTEHFLIPQADALINPKLPHCPYPFKQYCAGGLCFRFADALYHFNHAENQWKTDETDYLVLASIATICDLVELKADNRIIVKRALKLFKNTKVIGLNALLVACRIKDKEISPYHIGYIIGPCINASGRLMIAAKAVELFLSSDSDTANILSTELVALNQARKEITGEGTEYALMHLDNNQLLKDDKILVIYNENVQSSVAGIIAGKIKERFYKPVIMLTGDKDIVKGSCRSIEQYNIFKGLSEVRELLENFGGHPMAAGLSIKLENVEIFRKTINENCKLNKVDMQQLFHIDKVLNIYDADLNMAEALKVLEPFGKGNESPNFADKNVYIKKVVLLGKNKNIIKLCCYKSNYNKTIEIISFYLKDKFLDTITQKYGEKIKNDLLIGQGSVMFDLIYNLGVNEYNGNFSSQLIMIDFRIGE